MFDFLKKSKVQEPFTETTFECKRGGLTIRGTKYRPEGENLPVAIVIAHRRRFAGRDGK